MLLQGIGLTDRFTRLIDQLPILHNHVLQIGQLIDRVERLLHMSRFDRQSHMQLLNLVQAAGSLLRKLSLLSQQSDKLCTVLGC